MCFVEACSSQAALSWKRLNLMCDGEDLPTFSGSVSLPAWPSQVYPHCPETFMPTQAISLRRMRRIVDLNAYRCASPVCEYAFVDDEPQRDEKERHERYGVFPLASLFNHTCAPNMSKVLLGDWVFLRAARDISPGEELTQFYCDIRMPLEMRQKELKELFGFCCGCGRCSFEKSLQKSDQGLLQPWIQLYSSEVPGFHPKLGPIPVSQLEGLVGEAEAAAKIALKQTVLEPAWSSEVCESWLLWPLVPAFQQLATRLRLDGRRLESLEVWKRAESLAGGVVPLSNIHLRIHAEMLLTKGSKELLEENLRLVAAAFGGGEAVWQRLFGFRMPRAVAELAGTCSLTSQPSNVQYRWESSGSGVELLTLWSAAFKRQSEILIDVSPELVIVRAPGAVEQSVRFRHKALAEAIVTKFSKRRRCLTLQIPTDCGAASQASENEGSGASTCANIAILEASTGAFLQLSLAS